MASPLVYDVGLDSTGDLPARTGHITGLTLTRQRVDMRLRTFLGEYIADKSRGLPFFAWMQQKPPQVASIGALLRREIETTPGVARVEEWTGGHDPDTRELTYTCTVKTVDGDLTLLVAPLGDPGFGNWNNAFRLVIEQVWISPHA